MAEDTPDDGVDGGGEEITPSSPEDELAAAVDDALKDELKLQRARFVQQIMGLDRLEGVGRAHDLWNEDFYRSIGVDPPEKRTDEPPEEQRG